MKTVTETNGSGFDATIKEFFAWAIALAISGGIFWLTCCMIFIMHHYYTSGWPWYVWAGTVPVGCVIINLSFLFFLKKMFESGDEPAFAKKLKKEIMETVPVCLKTQGMAVIAGLIATYGSRLLSWLMIVKL